MGPALLYRCLSNFPSSVSIDNYYNILFSVVGFMDYYVQSYLAYIMNPDEIVSSNWDFEEELKLTKLMTEEFNNYRNNFSGDIVFYINDDSKI